MIKQHNDKTTGTNKSGTQYAHNWIHAYCVIVPLCM